MGSRMRGEEKKKMAKKPRTTVDNAQPNYEMDRDQENIEIDAVEGELEEVETMNQDFSFEDEEQESNKPTTLEMDNGQTIVAEQRDFLEEKIKNVRNNRQAQNVQSEPIHKAAKETGPCKGPSGDGAVKGVAGQTSSSGSSSEDDYKEDETVTSSLTVFKDSQHVDATSLVSSFTEMNLSKKIIKGLGALGMTKPTPIQAAAIPIALQGKDLLGGAVTGSGKTAAFLVPILERLMHRSQRLAQIRVLILLPTRELAAQCHEVARNIAKFTDIRIALVAGGLPIREQEAELRQRPEIIIATPGRLIDHLHNSPSFTLETIEILILDEADRMLEDGFADELSEIVRHCPDQRQTMLFSATMDETVQDLAKLSLYKPVRVMVDEATMIAKRLSQEFVRIREGKEQDRLPILVSLIERICPKRTIVFLPTKELAHRTRIILGLAGCNVAELHGGLDQVERMEALGKFKTGQADILVCTDVAARGLDICNVQSVVNYSMPVNYNQYLHRVGRTARAGQTGRSITMIGEGTDRKLLRMVIKNSTEPVKHRLIDPAVVTHYREKLKLMESEIDVVLVAEQEEKLLKTAESEVKRAENLLAHQKDIKSRPAKQWFQSTGDKKRAKQRERMQSKGDHQAKSGGKKRKLATKK